VAGGPDEPLLHRSREPITKDISNFDIDDEIYYDMDLLPEAKILAAAYTPNTAAGQRRQQRSPAACRRGRGEEEGGQYLRHPAAGVDL
jgi:type 1 glutamine amidotransferase